MDTLPLTTLFIIPGTSGYLACLKYITISYLSLADHIEACFPTRCERIDVIAGI